jgi:DNA-binding protein YbaB
MWLLHFLPDAFLAFVVDAVLIAGIISTLLTCFFLKYVIRLIPALSPHVRIAQIISVAVLLSGVYFRGGYSSEMAWRERVREVEEKLALAEKQSQAATEQLEKKSQQKVRVIQGRQVVVKQYIDREVTRYDSQCVIPKSFVQAHNDAAEAPKR